MSGENKSNYKINDTLTEALLIGYDCMCYNSHINALMGMNTLYAVVSSNNNSAVGNCLVPNLFLSF